MSLEGSAKGAVLRGKIGAADVVFIDAYAVAVQNGFDGTVDEWLASLHGKDGKDGADGADGADGKTPYVGENKNWWIDGVDTGILAEGTNGKDGKDGKDGTNGVDGKDGTDGVDGKDGSDGKSAFIRYSANADGTDFTETWTEGQNYVGFAMGVTAPTDKSGYTWCLFVTTKDTGFPKAVASEEEMNAVLAAATSEDVGKLYTMTGESTDTYEQGAIYMIEEVTE